jgi:hypothetical protein
MFGYTWSTKGTIGLNNLLHVKLIPSPLNTEKTDTLIGILFQI